MEGEEKSSDIILVKREEAVEISGEEKRSDNVLSKRQLKKIKKKEKWLERKVEKRL